MDTDFKKLMDSYWDTYQNYLNSMPQYKSHLTQTGQILQGFKEYLLNARDNFITDSIKMWEKEKNA